ncbi:hypothetical protein [Chryseobacterium takakiae]|uniref:Uncharacterized protein n=1 Tax=Chryseobacterium takakiae TaxID=1302685 RepID=A0A1M5BXX4_9FLAO|nr:hypothetical protein [Chryseobacterium takakiae]SHF47266.1 hypothetical protein SAMN05444408_1284 [Chryseobacterium takakiae]
MFNKNIFILHLFIMGVSGLLKSQVGINNNSPQATLDITAKTTDGSKPEGLLAPRLTGDQIKSEDLQYNAAQKGLIVYATSAVTLPSTKTANINSEGYYYFDGSTWQRMDTNTNIFNSNGALTGNRYVDLGTSSLGFIGSGNIGVGTISPNGSAALDINVNNRGFLPPRMTNTERNAIGSPATGLIVFSTTDGCLQINSGTPAAPNWGCIASQTGGGTAVVQVNSFTPNTPAGQALSEVCLGSICIRHDGAAAEGSIQIRSNTGSPIANTSVAGFQVATSGINEGNTVITTLATTYGSTIFYRGGASGGEFINYQISTGTGENYRAFLTLVGPSLIPGAGNGNYLLNLEKVR